MSLGAPAAIDADLARVSSAQQRLSAAHAEVSPLGANDPSEVQRGHAAVASAEAALEQAQAAVNADQANEASPVMPGAEVQHATKSPISTRYFDTVV